MKQIYFTVVALFFLVILLSACGPSKEELAATSAAETIAAASPTPTNTPTPTPTFTPTPTPTPTPTNTPTPTPLPQIGDTLVSKVDGMVLMYVPAGEFQMGSSAGDGDDDEHPKHPVKLDAFWMDQTEVTNAMFAIFVDAKGYQTAAERARAGLVYINNEWTWVMDANWLHPEGTYSNIDEMENYPFVQVNWNDAVAYCTWAGRRLPRG
jgi:formylglycine-generating enzyme required for sulfatase activity